MLLVGRNRSTIGRAFNGPVSPDAVSDDLPSIESGFASLQRLEQLRRVALLQPQIAHAVGLATENLRVTLVDSRCADNAGKTLGQLARHWIAQALAFKHKKTVGQTAQINAGALGKPDPVRVGHDVMRRRCEVMTPMPLIFLDAQPARGLMRTRRNGVKLVSQLLVQRDERAAVGVGSRLDP